MYKRYGIYIYLYHRWACSIPDKDTNTFVVTGGKETSGKVSRYNQNGWQEDLPDLKNGRWSHGCSNFVSGESETVMQVNFNKSLMFNFHF